ncbi:hypothetical protein KAW44_08295 [Candidatus Bipolaricaulota bacterium]|nr:hypothetical protein [Candidatus Bipolaricaulota bacterium]
MSRKTCVVDDETQSGCKVVDRDAGVRIVFPNNLSNCLSVLGDRPGALKVIQEVEEIRRRLAESNPARYEPDLATSLDNLTFLQREG